MKVTYVPRDPADPNRVRWAGVLFEANVPKEVAHPEIIAGAPTNPWFDVEGQAAKPKGGRPPNPKTAEEYRAFAINWINKAETAKGLNDRWTAEERLREVCGVGSDDLDAISLIMQPRLHHLTMADAA